METKFKYHEVYKGRPRFVSDLGGGGFTMEVISVKTGVDKVRRKPTGNRVDF